MAASHLTVVPDESEIYVVGKGPETRAERIRRMQANARALAREEIEAMVQAMEQVARMAEQIAQGGDAFPVGVRELSSRLHNDIEGQAKAVEALMMRS